MLFKSKIERLFFQGVTFYQLKNKTEYKTHYQRQSNLSMGEGFNQGRVGGGQGQQPARNTPGPGGGIMARIQATMSCHDNATVKRELDWQARVEGDGYKAVTFRPGVGGTNLSCFCIHEGQITGGPHGPLGRDFLQNVGGGDRCAGQAHRVCRGLHQWTLPSLIHPPPPKCLGMDKGKIPTQHCKVWDIL
jgi:hypothetical protein